MSKQKMSFNPSYGEPSDLGVVPWTKGSFFPINRGLSKIMIKVFGFVLVAVGFGVGYLVRSITSSSSATVSSLGAGGPFAGTAEEGAGTTEEGADAAEEGEKYGRTTLAIAAYAKIQDYEQVTGEQYQLTLGDDNRCYIVMADSFSTLPGNVDTNEIVSIK